MDVFKAVRIKQNNPLVMQSLLVSDDEALTFIIGRKTEPRPERGDIFVWRHAADAMRQAIRSVNHRLTFVAVVRCHTSRITGTVDSERVSVSALSFSPTAATRAMKANTYTSPVGDPYRYFTIAHDVTPREVVMTIWWTEHVIRVAENWRSQFSDVLEVRNVDGFRVETL